MSITLLQSTLRDLMLLVRELPERITSDERAEIDNPPPGPTSIKMAALFGREIEPPSVFEVERHQALIEREDSEITELGYFDEKVFEAYNAIEDKSTLVNELDPQELKLLKLVVAQKAVHNLVVAVESKLVGKEIDVVKIDEDLKFSGIENDKAVIDGLKKAQMRPDELNALLIDPMPTPYEPTTYPSMYLVDDLTDLFCRLMGETIKFQIN